MVNTLHGSSVVLYTKVSEDLYLVQLSYRNQEPFKDKLQVPGGKIDPGETPSQAAIREVKEETGLVIPESSLYEEGLFEEKTPEKIFSINFYSLEIPLITNLSNPEPEKHGDWRFYNMKIILNSERLLYTLKPVFNQIMGRNQNANNNNNIGHTYQT